MSDDIDSYLGELFGLNNGVMNGKGGSMHLKSLKDGLEASIPIVGSSIGLSLGSALAHKIFDEKSSRTISYFGDGACEEGIFHESLNLSGIYQLPLLFICENNMYSCNTLLMNRQTSSEMIRFAKSHKIEFASIKSEEGLDSIINKLRIAFEKSTKGPYFLEIHSYRFFEHCGHKKDRSNGDRSEKEYTFFREIDKLNQWMSSEPLVLKVFQESYKDCKAKC